MHRRVGSSEDLRNAESLFLIEDVVAAAIVATFGFLPLGGDRLLEEVWDLGSGQSAFLHPWFLYS